MCAKPPWRSRSDPWSRVTAHDSRWTLWRRVCFLVVAAVGLLVTSGARSNVYVNFTRSLPIGIYRRVSGVPTRGDLVVACLPKSAAEFARDRGYLWRGSCPGRVAAIGKVVLALAGDTVSLTRVGFAINGRPVPNSRVVDRDSKGRAISHYPFGRYVVRRDEAWLFSPFHPLSFDSRYCGPVDMNEVRARIAPLWTSVGVGEFPCAPSTEQLPRSGEVDNRPGRR